MIQNKVKSKLIFTEKRFNAGYFLNEDALNSFKLEINPQNCIALSELANVFNPPIFKRQFCQPSERAINYCQSSDVTNALEGSDVYINKKQAEKVGSVVKKNQILVTGFGTIGNTRLVNELSEGISYANNVCRIESNGKFPYGYLYAFMTSKFGRSQLNKNASGSVVRYIEAPGIKRTLVPILPEEKQQQIHQLIVDSANLRVEANKLLKEAVGFFKFLDTTYKAGTYNVKNISSNTINNFKKRFDANYNIINNYVDNIKSNQKIEFIKINELTENIFIGPRSKRNYISNGIPFLSTSEMQKANPTKTEKFVNQNVGKDFQVKEGWLLTTRSGTLGDTIYTLPCINNFAVSEDAIRIQFKQYSILSNKYVYAFLKSNLGRNSLLAGSYGSVILHLNEDYVGNVEVPILEKNTIKEIEEKIDLHLFNLNEAILKENQAINLIENEIDAWQ